MNNSAYILLMILALLSSFIVWLKIMHWPSLSKSVYQRVISWWYIIVTITVCGQSSVSLYFLIGVVINICLYELACIGHCFNGQRLKWMLVFTLILLMQLGFFVSSFIIVLIAVMCSSYALLLISRGARNQSNQVFLSAALICVLGLSMSSVILYATEGLLAEGSAGTLLFLVLISQTNDVAQYCWGKLIGGRKIAPQISPNKTWAGFLGGLVSVTLLGLLFGSKLTTLSDLNSGIAASLICILGFYGDILVSAYKRYYGIKDMGKLLPGHGGLGDRVDSLLLSSGGFYVYLCIIG